MKTSQANLVLKLNILTRKKSVYLYLDVEEEIILEMGLIHMSVHGVNGTKLCMLQAICAKKMSLLFLTFIN